MGLVISEVGSRGRIEIGAAIVEAAVCGEGGYTRECVERSCYPGLVYSESAADSGTHKCFHADDREQHF